MVDQSNWNESQKIAYGVLKAVQAEQQQRQLNKGEFTDESLSGLEPLAWQDAVSTEPTKQVTRSRDIPDPQLTDEVKIRRTKPEGEKVQRKVPNRKRPLPGV
jgi:hypothetical protein